MTIHESFILKAIGAMILVLYTGIVGFVTVYPFVYMKKANLDYICNTYDSTNRILFDSVSLYDKGE